MDTLIIICEYDWMPPIPQKMQKIEQKLPPLPFIDFGGTPPSHNNTSDLETPWHWPIVNQKNTC